MAKGLSLDANFDKINLALQDLISGLAMASAATNQLVTTMSGAGSISSSINQITGALKKFTPTQARSVVQVGAAMQILVSAAISIQQNSSAAGALTSFAASITNLAAAAQKIKNLGGSKTTGAAATIKNLGDLTKVLVKFTKDMNKTGPITAAALNSFQEFSKTLGDLVGQVRNATNVPLSFTGFTNFMDALKKEIAGLAGLNLATVTQSSIRAISSLISAFSKLSDIAGDDKSGVATGQMPGVVHELIVQVKRIFVELSGLSTVAGATPISLDFTSSVKSSINAISQLMRSFARLGDKEAIDIGTVRANVTQLATSMGDIQLFVEKINVGKDAVTSVNAISRFLTAIIRLGSLKVAANTFDPNDPKSPMSQIAAFMSKWTRDLGLLNFSEETQKTLKSLSSLISAFSKIIDLSKNGAALAQDVEANVNLLMKSIRDIFDEITGQHLAPAGGPAVKFDVETRASLAAIVRIMNAMQELAKPSFINSTSLTANVTSLGTNIQALNTAAAGANISKTAQDSIVAISKFVQALVSLATTKIPQGMFDSGSQISEISQLLGSLKKIFDMVAEFTKEEKIEATTKGFSSLLRSVGTMVKEIGSLDVKDFAGSEGQAMAVITFVGNMLNRLAEITSSVRNIESVITLTAAINSIAKGLKTLFSKEFKEAFEGAESSLFATTRSRWVLEGIGANFLAVGRVFRQIAEADMDFYKEKGGLRFRGLKLRYSETGRVVQYIEGLAKSISSITTGVRNVEGIQELSTGIHKLILSVKAIGKLESVPGALKQFALFNPLARVLRIGSFNKTLKFIQYISKALSAMTGGLKNVQDVATLGTGLKNLVTGFRAFEKLTRDLPTAWIPRLARLFGMGKTVGALRSIGFVLKNVASTAKDISPDKIEALATVGRALLSVTQFMRRIAKEDFTLSKNRLEPVLEVLNDFFNAAKKLKGLGNVDLKGFASLILMLQKIVTEQGTQGFNINAAKQFSEFMKYVAEGLNNFGRVNINAKKINALAGLGNLQGLNSISNFSMPEVVKQKTKGLAQRAGEGFNNEAEAFGANYTRSFFDSVLRGAASSLAATASTFALGKIAALIKPIFRADLVISEFLRNTGQRLTQFGYQVQNLGRDLLRTFGIERFFRSEGFTLAREFDDLSVKLSVFAQNIPLKEAQDFANLIGIKYPQSANEALQAILDLSKAGRDFASIKEILPNAADLSTIGGVDLQVATQGLIAAASQFRSSGFAEGVPATFENIAAASDIIAAAADVSQAEVADLIEALTTVGPAASTFGLTLEETNAALAAFSNFNIRGSEAGTQLKSAINALNREAAKEELARLGVALYDAQGNLLPFAQIIDTLRERMNVLGLTQQQVADSLADVADSYGRTGIQVLLMSDSLNVMTEAMGGVETAAARAEKLFASFDGQVAQLEGSLDTLKTRAFVPMIQKAFLPLVKIGRAVADFFGTLPDDILETAGNVFLLTTAFGSLTGGMLLFVGAASRVGGAILNISGIMFNMTKIIPQIIAGFATFGLSLGVIVVAGGAVLGVLTTIAFLFSQVTRSIENNAGGAGDAFEELKDIFDATFGVIGQTIQTIGGTIGRVFAEITGGAPLRFGERLVSLFDRISDSLRDFQFGAVQVGAVIEVFGEFFDAMHSGNLGDIDRVTDKFEGLATLPLVRTLFGGGNPSQVVRNINRVFHILNNLVHGLASGFNEIASGFIGVLFGEKGAQAKLKHGAQVFFGTVAQLLQSITGLDFSESILQFDEGNIRSGLEGILGTVLNGIREWIVANQSGITSIFTSIFRIPFNFAEGLLSLFGLDSASSFVRQIGDDVAHAVGGALGFAFDLLEGNVDFSFQALMDSIFGENVDIGEVVGNIGNTIRDIVRSIPEFLKEQGRVAQIPFLETIGSILGTSNGLTLFENALGLGSSGLSLSGQTIVDTIANVFGSIPEAVVDIFTGLSTSIPLIIEGLNSGNPAVIIPILGGLALLLKQVAGTGVGKGVLSFAKFGAVLVVIQAAVDNLHTLIEGDIGGFLSGTFRSILREVGDLLAPIVGFDGEEAVRRFDIFARGVGDIINAFADRIIDRIYQVRVEVTALGDIDAARRLEAIRDLFYTPDKSGLEYFTALADASREISRMEFGAFTGLSGNRQITELNNLITGSGGIDNINDQQLNIIKTVLDYAGLTENAINSVRESFGELAATDLTERFNLLEGLTVSEQVEREIINNFTVTWENIQSIVEKKAQSPNMGLRDILSEVFAIDFNAVSPEIRANLLSGIERTLNDNLFHADMGLRGGIERLIGETASELNYNPTLNLVAVPDASTPASERFAYVFNETGSIETAYRDTFGEVIQADYENSVNMLTTVRLELYDENGDPLEEGFTNQMRDYLDSAVAQFQENIDQGFYGTSAPKRNAPKARGGGRPQHESRSSVKPRTVYQLFDTTTADMLREGDNRLNLLGGRQPGVVRGLQQAGALPPPAGSTGGNTAAAIMAQMSQNSNAAYPGLDEYLASRESGQGEDEDPKEVLEDFYKEQADQARQNRLEDQQDQEKYDLEERQRIEEEHAQDIKDAEEHAKKLTEIEEKGNKEVFAAVISRSSTQAQAAQASAKEERKNELEEYEQKKKEDAVKRAEDEKNRRDERALDIKHRDEDRELDQIERMEELSAKLEEIEDKNAANEAYRNETLAVQQQIIDATNRYNEEQEAAAQASLFQQAIDANIAKQIQQAYTDDTILQAGSIFSTIGNGIAQLAANARTIMEIRGVDTGSDRPPGWNDPDFRGYTPPPSTFPPGGFPGVRIIPGSRSSTPVRQPYGGGRASGGVVNPFTAYDIFDTNKAEIAQIGNRTMLLNGRDRGYVTPIDGPARNGSGGNLTIMIEMNNSFPEGTPMDAMAAAIEERIVNNVGSIVARVRSSR